MKWMSDGSLQKKSSCDRLGVGAGVGSSIMGGAFMASSEITGLKRQRASKLATGPPASGGADLGGCLRVKSAGSEKSGCVPIPIDRLPLGRIDLHACATIFPISHELANIRSASGSVAVIHWGGKYVPDWFLETRKVCGEPATV